MKSAETDTILIRTMEAAPEDFKLYLKWMSDPGTKKYYGGVRQQYTYEIIAEKYQEHLAEKVQPCIIEYEHTPVGYCQFYVVHPNDYEVPEEQYFAFVDPKDLVYGIDLFLGTEQYRNRGIGTACLKLLMDALFKRYGADALMIDPKTHNQRAIRCYHKCGFEDYFIVPKRELQDGVRYDSLIMGIKRES